MDYTIILSVLIVIGLTGFFIYMRNKNFKYYDEVRLALLLVGMSFKDVKIKGIANTAMEIVQQLEILDMASEQKQKEAIKEAAKVINEKFNITLDDEVLATIIDIAVAHMPENQK